MKIFSIIFYPISFIFNYFYKIKIKKFFCNVNIEKIDALNGFEFEELVGLIFKYYGYKVLITKKSNDFGADLIVSKRSIKIAVQTKLYYGHSVGNSAIQEIKSSLKLYNAVFGCVVTNWKFSNQAKTLAKAQNIMLLDRQNILEFLQNIKQNLTNAAFNDLYKNWKIEVKEI